MTIKIVSEFGETIGPMNCGSKLGVDQFCSLRTLIDNSTAYACVATAASITNLRGGFVFHKHFLNESGSLTLHPIRFAPLR